MNTYDVNDGIIIRPRTMKYKYYIQYYINIHLTIFSRPILLFNERPKCELNCYIIYIRAYLLS